MTWVKIDDHFDEHPKMAAVGPIGWGVWLALLAYCNRNLTDGFVPRAVADGIGGPWRIYEAVEGDKELVWTLGRTSGMRGENMSSEWVIDRLYVEGLLDSAPGGYQMHDYLDFQPSRADVLKERAAHRSDKVAAGRASAAARRNKYGSALPRNARNAASAEQITEQTEQGAEQPPNPVPVPVPGSIYIEPPYSPPTSEDEPIADVIGRISASFRKGTA